LRSIEELFPDGGILWDYAIKGRNLAVYGDLSYGDIFGNEFSIHYFARIDPPANIAFLDPVVIGFDLITSGGQRMSQNAEKHEADQDRPEPAL